MTPPRRIYLAARFSKAPEMRRKRDAIQTLGHQVFSRWLDGHHGITDDDIAALDSGQLTGADAAEIEGMAGTYGGEDLADLCKCDLLIVEMEPPRTHLTRGGMHTEIGIMVALEREIWLVAHRSNVFHFRPGVRFFPRWSELLAELAR